MKGIVALHLGQIKRINFIVKTFVVKLTGHFDYQGYSLKGGSYGY